MSNNDVIMFFRENEKHGFLSNFYICKIDHVYKNKIITFNSSEHFFMFKKCLEFEPENDTLLLKIINAKSCTEAKKLGRTIKNFDEKKWIEIRYYRMLEVVLYKFLQNRDIALKLVNLKGNIYEASPYDSIWGIGLNMKQALNTNTNEYGLNLLGKCLEKVRSFLQNIYKI